MHCNRSFMSNEMWFQRVIGDKSGFAGFWMCPTPNCDGAGFTFDIFPTDPNHPANDGWSEDDGDDDGEFDDEAFADDDEDEADAEWDPAESKYAELDQLSADEDDDLEGEEWKYGLQPGERPESAMSDGQREWEEQQKRYDMPDERPRVLDWTNREDHDSFNTDDIPF